MQNVLFNVQSREIWIWHVRPSTPATRDWRFRIVISCTCQKHGGDTSIAAKCDYFAKIMQTRIFRIRNINVVFFFFYLHLSFPSRLSIRIIVNENNPCFFVSDSWRFAIWQPCIVGYYFVQRRCLMIGRWDPFLWLPRWPTPEIWPPVYSSAVAWS